MPQCEHISRQGNRCDKSTPLDGRFCGIHDPDILERRRNKGRLQARRYKALPTAEIPPLSKLESCLDALSIVCKEAFIDRKYSDAVSAIKAAGKLCQDRDDRTGTISAGDLAAMGDEEIRSLGSLTEEELHTLHDQIKKGRG